MFRRAAREIRVIAGLLLIAAAIATAIYEVSHLTGQADRDFALCGGPRQAPDCVSKQRPVSVVWTPANNGDPAGYEIVAQTSPRVTMSLFGLSKADVAPFRGTKTVELRYRQGRLVAFVAPDGTSLEVPFAFTKDLLFAIAFVILGGLLGMGSVAWGLTRANRTPKA